MKKIETPEEMAMLTRDVERHLTAMTPPNLRLILVAFEVGDKTGANRVAYITPSSDTDMHALRERMNG